MTVTVRLFAILRERVGVSSIDVELPERATVEDALKVLRRRRELGDVLARIPVRVAVNREYVEPGDALHAATSSRSSPPSAAGPSSGRPRANHR